MKSTPSSTARRTTACAASISSGSPHAPSPMIRIAPKPIRLTSPRSLIVTVPAFSIPMAPAYAGALRRVGDSDGETAPGEPFELILADAAVGDEHFKLLRAADGGEGAAVEFRGVGHEDRLRGAAHHQFRYLGLVVILGRSEERRVGNECSCRRGRWQ